MTTTLVRAEKHRSTFFTQDDDYRSDEREWAFKRVDDAKERQCAVVLDAAYPGYSFTVDVSHFHGIAQVKLPTFSDWPEVVHLKDLKGDPRLKLVIDAAARFLERYQLPRQKADLDAVDAAVLKHMPHLTHRLRPPD
jgi:hypothetical protein